jgi:hypothetical protein
MPSYDNDPDDAPIPDALGVPMLEAALQGCRNMQLHYKRSRPDAAAYNEWKRHARAIAWALRCVGAVDVLNRYARAGGMAIPKEYER